MPVFDAVVLNQGAIGLAAVLAGGAYLLAVLVPLSARTSMRSRLLLGTGIGARALAALLFSVPGIAFSILVMLLVAGGAYLWLLEPIPRLHGVEAVREHRVQAGNDRLVMYVGGWTGASSDRRLVELMARDPRLHGADLLSVDYVELLAARRPRLIELAQALHDQVHGRLADRKYRAVILVGHSVGGLLARWWAVPAAGASAPPLVALIDLAVPKAGADPGALAEAIGLPAGLMRELDDRVGFVGGALQRWRGLGAAAAPVACFHGANDRAVARDSAFAGCARRHDELALDHRGIAAPDSAETLAYRRAVALLEEGFAGAAAR